MTFIKYIHIFTKMEHYVEKEQVKLMVHRISILPDDVVTLCAEYYYVNRPINEKESKAMAEQIGADMYIPHSALTQQGLKAVFDEAIRSALRGKRNQTKKSKK
eukprot:281873_1